MSVRDRFWDFMAVRLSEGKLREEIRLVAATRDSLAGDLAGLQANFDECYALMTRFESERDVARVELQRAQAAAKEMAKTLDQVARGTRGPATALGMLDDFPEFAPEGKHADREARA